MSHLCIKPVCGASCHGCNHAISEAATLVYALRYAYLRQAPLDAIKAGGVFVGKTPDNIVLNGADLDQIVDASIREGGAA